MWFLACAKLSFAQLPTATFTPAPTVNDFVSFQNTNATLVAVVDDGHPIQIALSQYLGGVLSGELGIGASSNRQDAYTAQAIAACTKWCTVNETFSGFA